MQENRCYPSLALRQCSARPGELCRATIADIDRTSRVIVLREQKTVCKTGKPRRIPIGRKLAELLEQAIGERNEGPIFLSPSGKGWSVQNLSRTYSPLLPCSLSPPRERVRVWGEIARLHTPRAPA